MFCIVPKKLYIFVLEIIPITCLLTEAGYRDMKQRKLLKHENYANY